MAIVKPQPRARQRALLREWGIDERFVPEFGIDSDGILIVGTYQPEGFDAIGGTLMPGELPQTRYAYRSPDERLHMLAAREADWAEFSGTEV